jgi:farnesyl diphosphate synthase
MSVFDLKAWMQPHLERVEQALSQGIAADSPAQLGEAMRYAVLDGGKRLRPLLVLATAEAVGDAPQSAAALNAACALELIHAYSLVHDDMPCMDNDVLRRGKPTVHVQFGEAQALLAGDALQTLAFEMLTPADNTLVSPAVQAACVGLLARASGYQGMAGGQAIDLASVGHRLSEDQLRQMHRLKTGALLLCSVHMGAACVPGVSATVQAALSRFGQALGLAFQVVDDVLDVTADSATLGKTAGKDEAADKPTYVALMGLDAAKAYADALAAEAVQALADTGLPEVRLAALRALTAMVVERNN